MTKAFNETTFYDALRCLVIRLDEQWNVWFVNRFGLDLLGYERLGQLFGKPFRTVLPDDDAASVELMAIVRNLKLKKYPDPFESDLLRQDGSHLPVSWNLNYLGDDAERVAPTVLVGFDASLVRKNRAAAALFQTVSDNYRQHCHYRSGQTHPVRQSGDFSDDGLSTRRSGRENTGSFQVRANR